MDFSNFLLFLTASLTINAIPGVDVVYVISNDKQNGCKAAYASIFGLFIGYLVHVFITSVGIAKIIATNDTLFYLITYLGAIYLIYLGILMCKEVMFRCESDELINETLNIKPEISFYQYSVKGALISILNPKVTLFFLSFIPQFLNQENSTSLLPIFLGFVFAIGATLFNLLYCYLSRLNIRLSIRGIQYLPGLLLILLGVYPLLT